MSVRRAILWLVVARNRHALLLIVPRRPVPQAYPAAPFDDARHKGRA
jgi:hypothetical protein